MSGSNSTIQEGVLKNVSASQVTAFELCPMKWVLDKKFHVPRKPPGKGAEFGTAAHGRIEHFLKMGEDVRGPVEKAGAAMLEPFLWAAPFNKGRGEVEKAFEFFTPRGVRVNGFIDFYIKGGWHRSRTPDVPPFSASLQDPIVIDHKFKKDLEKYAVSEEDLQNDPQALVYGKFALSEAPETHGFVFRHHNHQTQGPRYNKPVEVKFTRDDLLKRYGVLEKTIDDSMYRIASTPCETVEEAARLFPYNEGACAAFGGCDYLKQCPKSPVNRFLSGLKKNEAPVTENKDASPEAQTAQTEVQKGSKQMGLLSQAKAAASTPAPTAPSVTTAPVGEIVGVTECKPGAFYATPKGPVGKFHGVVQGRYVFRLADGGICALGADEIVAMADGFTTEAVTTQTAPAVVTAAPVAPAPEKERKLLVKLGNEAPLPITPPDMPKETAPTAETAKVEIQATEVAAVAVSATEVKTTEVEAKPVTVEVKTEDAVKEEPKKAVRKRAAPGTAAMIAGSAPEPTEFSGLVLLVNCSTPGAKDLAGYVADLAAKLAQAHGVADIRLGNKQSDLGFGGWKALLSLEALKNVPAGIYSVQSSELADPVIEALIPKAQMVVRPVVSR